MSVVADLRRRTRLRRLLAFRTYLDALRRTVPGDRPLRLFDLGGTVAFWEDWWGVGERDGLHITLVNNHDADTTQKTRRSRFDFVDNIERDATTLTAADFAPADLVFSNSFFEHLNSWSQQRALAAQVVASGKPYFVQVPNKNSPLDPHHPFAPFFALYPKPLRVRLLTISTFGNGARCSLADAQRWQDAYTPLGLRDMKMLFPDATFQMERPLGVPMSILACRGAH